MDAIETTVIDLRIAHAAAVTLLTDSLTSFEKEHASVRWSTVALESSPVNGWMAIGFDTTANSASLVRTFQGNGPAWYGEDECGRFNNNCADFKFPQYRLLQLPEWEREYFENHAAFTYVDLHGDTHVVDMGEAGDEGFNEIVFEILLRVRESQRSWVLQHARHAESIARFGVQLCDSEFVDFAALHHDPHRV